MTRYGRWLVLASVGVVLAATAGCDGSSSDSDGGKPAVCGEGTSHGCFDLGSYGNLYCTVLQTRESLDEGRIKLSDLPTWADPATLGESVQIFNFRQPPESDLSGAQYTQELLNALHDKGLLQSSAELEKRDTCLDGLTQRKVAATEGGWPAA